MPDDCSDRLTRRCAMAVAAHPDDIEFLMAGTLLLLKEAGYETHYMTVASGSCGSSEHNAAATRTIRLRESMEAARVLGARYHPSCTDDLEIFYEARTLRRVAAIVREVKPTVLLTHSPQDYMEDHVNTCRLAVTAGFARGMPNFRTIPAREPWSGETTVYHAMPHGLRDGLRRLIIPGLFANTTKVERIKRAALAAHESQRSWLGASQGMNSHLASMKHMGMVVGKMSRKFKYAEGWRRHSHLGFCDPQADPLRAALKNNCLINLRYERELNTGFPSLRREKFSRRGAETPRTVES